MEAGKLRKVKIEVWTTEETGCVSTQVSDHLGDKFYICEDGDAPTDDIPEGPRRYFKLSEAPEKPVTERELGGRRRFEQRYERLGRLYDLSAPTVILANEVLLVLDAMRLIDPDAVSVAEGRRSLERVLRASRLCTVCERKLSPGRAEDMCEECDSDVD